MFICLYSYIYTFPQYLYVHIIFICVDICIQDYLWLWLKMYINILDTKTKNTHTYIYIYIIYIYIYTYMQRYRCRCRTWCRCRYKRTELSESDTEDFDPIPGSSERLCTTSLQRLVGPRMAAWRLRPALRWLPLAGAMPLCRGSLALCGYARPTPLEERALRRQTLVCVSPFAAVHFRRHIAWVSCARPWLSLKRKLTQSEPCA